MMHGAYGERGEDSRYARRDSLEFSWWSFPEDTGKVRVFGGYEQGSLCTLFSQE